MILDIEYDDKTFIQFDREQAIAAGIPDEVFDAAVSAMSLKGVRARRNQLIADCDWSVLSDAPLSTEQKAAWKAYRTALRNFPETLQTQNIAPEIALNDNSVWPVKPS